MSNIRITIIVLFGLSMLMVQFVDAQTTSKTESRLILDQHNESRTVLNIEEGGNIGDERFLPPHLREKFSQRHRTSRKLDLPETEKTFGEFEMLDEEKIQRYRRQPWEKDREKKLQSRWTSIQEQNSFTPVKNATAPAIPQSDTLAPEWVAHYANRLNKSIDQARAIAVDISGNVYVTGSSDSSFAYDDIVTIKYNSSGIMEWKARYNWGYDFATAIAVDGVGNVYVTGESSMDYVIIKYNSSGVQQWVARYNGPANSHDCATAIAVDGSGNVHVTGNSNGSGTDYDYATIKYNNSGIQQWIARYNGPGNSRDVDPSLAVDGSGNVYVTGGSLGSGTDYDYATIKYNTSGVQQWVQRYNGPGNYGDFAYDVAVDSSGNVYVSGESAGSGTSYDYATIKYNTSGVQQWIQRYNGPGNLYDGSYAITVDNSRNVYVTGYSYGTYYDYATIKYDSLGVEQWVARYNGPVSSGDFANAISVDGAGNVYVTGISEGSGTYNYDYATIKYNTSGVEQWVARYNGPGNDRDYANASAVDDAGNVYVTGYSYGGISYVTSDYATIKYNSEGVEQWVARYNGPGNFNDEATSIAVDNSGNVYVTGRAISDAGCTPPCYTYATIKYNTEGIKQWVTLYGNTFGFYGGLSIAVDNDGNVYVTGGNLLDYATIKYNSEGVEEWVAQYNGPGNSEDGATAIVVDGSGNMYVTGYSSSTSYPCNLDYATIKYNSSGVEQWVSRYNGPGNDDDYAKAIAIDAVGNVYVTGYSSGSGTWEDYATIKYNTNGVEQWVRRYNGTGNSRDEVTAIAVDGFGNVYVTGFSYGSGTSYDYATIKYNNWGVEQWVQRYNGPVNSYDEATAISVDESENVYVTGNSCSSGGYNADYATIKYNSLGEEQWVSRYNGPGNADDYANSITVSDSGNAYVTGSSYGSDTYTDYATIKYNSLGEEQWVARYNGLGNSYDYANSIAIDNHENVYVTGSSMLTGNIYTTIKYRQLIPPIFSQSHISFIDTEVSCRSSQILIIRNIGISTILINSAFSDDSNFTISPSSVSINHNDSALFIVTFSTLSTGPKSGNIIFIYNAPSSPDTVTVSGVGTGEGNAIIVSKNYGTGWQLISLPVSVVCPYVLGNLFEYKGSYIPCDTLKNEKGYWKKLNEPELYFAGFPILSDTVPVNIGWNIIGSISDPIHVSSIISIPEGIITSQFFKYEDIYKTADGINPGHGYWIKVNQAGELVLLSTGSVTKFFVQTESSQDFNEITISDAQGKSRTLYFTNQLQNRSLEWYELPPFPPEGNFDVRYASGRMLEVAGNDVEFPIVISSAEYPVTINWELTSAPVKAFLNVNGQEISLLTNGTTQINNPDLQISLSLTAAPAQPIEYLLEQNHPNPFNHITVFRYQLPVESKVTLRIFNVLGQQVSILMDEVQNAGYKSVTFDASNLPSGVYFYRMTAGHPSASSGQWYTEIKKMILLR